MGILLGMCHGRRHEKHQYGQMMAVPMTVLVVYPNGDFSGEIVYAEA